MKRLLDMFFSSIALLILSPIFFIVILALRFTGEGEIFFFQKRVGKDRNLFKLYKFATMLKDSERIGTKTITIKNDPRILPLGRFLRKTKINELPQLINIFIGDMSFVGPRPLTLETFSFYDSYVQDHIATVRPGLSGIGSIFFRDEENLLQEKGNNATAFYRDFIAPYKGQLEVWYVSNKTTWTYIKVILVTAWVVIFPKSIAISCLFKGLPEPSDELKVLIN